MWYPIFRPRWARRGPWGEFGEDWGGEPEERTWAPPVDIFDLGDRLVIYADLPGVDRESIDVTLEGDTLTLRAERKAYPEEADYLCCERTSGTYRRVIQIPMEVDAQNIEAHYEDGILKITLPKAPELKPRKISIAAK